ncbi:MAG: universal stress protein [Ilumatobacter sp.]
MSNDPTTGRTGASSGGLVARGPVVVGTDGSPEAARGLEFAADLAHTVGAEVIAVHAYGLVGNRGNWRDGVEARERAADEAMATEWCEPLADRPGLKWRWTCVQGSAARGLLREAERVDAAFVVVATHGAGGSGRSMLGSTSADIVLHSQCPVVVVPPDREHRHRRAGSAAVEQ